MAEQIVNVSKILMEDGLCPNGTCWLNPTENFNISQKVADTSKVYEFYVGLILNETSDPKKYHPTDYIVAQSIEFIGMDKLTLMIGGYLVRIIGTKKCREICPKKIRLLHT